MGEKVCKTNIPNTIKRFCEKLRIISPNYTNIAAANIQEFVSPGSSHTIVYVI